MKKKKWLLLLLVLALAVCLTVQWVIWADTALECNEIVVACPDLPENFNGYRIAHISDLHNAEYGEGNEKLLTLLAEAKPDIIAITGDLVDSRETNIDVALNFAREAVKIAPCYYATGNHESRVQGFAELEQGLKAAGVVVLRNESTVLEKNGQAIQIIGLDDYTFFDGSSGVECVNNMLQALERVNGEAFSVLLSHRPEFVEEMSMRGIEVILSGHAHGGQIRLPFVGGLYGPDQGYFPEYDAGLFCVGNTSMVVSRGLGNSQFPFRVNNRPEVVLIILEKETSK